MGLSHVRVSLAVKVSYLLIIYIRCDDTPDKRILLSDPSYVQQQMTHLQGELQTLQGKTQTLETTVQTQNGKISSLEHQLSQANNETQNQHSEIAALNQKLTQETQTQNSAIASLNQQLSQATQNQNSEIAALKQQLSHAIQDVGGATFVRWGRTGCPSNLTELVYSGYAGGSWHSDSGAAADHLCLPRDPEWSQTTVVPDGDYTGRIYGSEYEPSNTHTLFGSQSHNEDVPCAVCRSSFFVSSVMIPARMTCYSGWTTAYSGSLASGYHLHPAATEYVCVDEHAQPLSGGADRDDNGLLFYGVKAFCGSLPCPPYEQDSATVLLSQ